MVDEQALGELVRFHGHMCAALAWGARASEVGRRELPHRLQDVDGGLVCMACAESHRPTSPA